MDEIEFESGDRLIEVETDSRGRVTLGSEYADETLRLLVEDKRGLEELDVYFHRLGLSVTRRGILDIFMQRKMAMDWNVGGMRNPWIFEKVAKDRADNTNRSGRGVRSDARNLYRLSLEGGLVAAYFGSEIFDEHPISDRFDSEDLGDVILLGRVEPDTEIEPVEYPHTHGGKQYMNTLQMVDTVEVHEGQYPDMFGNYPRGTIRNWDAKEGLVREVYAEERDSPRRYTRREYEGESG